MPLPSLSSVTITPASGSLGDVFRAVVTASGTKPITYSYRWRLNGRTIAGATGSSHTPAAAGALSVRVTATNSLGSATRESAAVTVTPALAAPASLAAPAIAGTPQVGQTLTATSDGSWSGYPAPTLTRNWQRNGVDIANATGATYAVQSADAGNALRLRVTASNSALPASALCTA